MPIHKKQNGSGTPINKNTTAVSSHQALGVGMVINSRLLEENADQILASATLTYC